MSDYNPFSLAGKTVLVTGASSGIGRSIAVECSRMGAQVVLTARNAERLEQTYALLAGEGHSFFPADLTDPQAIVSLAENVPLLHGVVHCAGVLARVLAKQIRPQDLEYIMRPNFEAPVLLQRELLRCKRIAREGSVVFIASQAPFAPAVGNAIYSASKAAVLGYANVLSLELAPQKIRVNSICPAMVWTELAQADAQVTGQDYEQAQQAYPLKRYGRPEDIAYLSVYLLSDASSWMTGSCIDITGGARNP